MKILFILIFSILFLSGCTKKEEKKQETEKIKTETEKKDSIIIDKEPEGAVRTGTEQINPDATETVTDIKYGIKDIPKSVKYTGKIVASAGWKDKNGNNLLIITETKEKKVRDAKTDGNYFEQEAAYSKDLYGYLYLISPDSAELVWKIQDFEKECDADLTLNYIKNSLTITDLNNNGIAENVFLYEMGCRSDVSPLGYKLMMHEGKEKYAIRGTKYLPDTPGAGETKVDPSFDNTPKEFLDYAKKQWKKFQNQ